MKKSEIHILAEKIARHLFTNGVRERADRLVLTAEGSTHDLGGWSERGAIHEIEAVLRRELESR